ncbi:hypothetical protein [Mycolicibacter longobardus]|uniref:hypothetical protein n=1 Tax=Mycolicibacter longobardus TaxID=1108812 RepID=UPI0010550F0A|nr:hypothetical protein [Mycolicibacter longobardus]MCV7384002.1 hypothetical protein [Mycolicibacter longobardus]
MQSRGGLRIVGCARLRRAGDRRCADGGRPVPRKREVPPAPGFAALATGAALTVAGPLRPASPRWRPATTLSE